MDSFLEQLVVRKQTSLDLYKRAGLVIGGLLLIFLSLAVLPAVPGIIGQVFSMVGIFLAAGIAFGIYYGMSFFSLEYEYILTGAELDIDKIIGKRRRKRLLSLSATSVTGIGPYRNRHAAAQKNQQQTLLLACAAVSDPDTYYLAFHDPKHGQATLLFTPNDKMLHELKRHIKRSLWSD